MANIVEKLASALGAMAAVGAIVGGLAIANADPTPAPSTVIDTPEPGDTPDVPGQPDLPESGDTPDTTAPVAPSAPR